MLWAERYMLVLSYCPTTANCQRQQSNLRGFIIRDVDAGGRFIVSLTVDAAAIQDYGHVHLRLQTVYENRPNAHF